MILREIETVEITDGASEVEAMVGRLRGNLKQLLAEEGMTVNRFAKEVGLPQRTLSDFVRAKGGGYRTSALRRIERAIQDWHLKKSA